MSVSVITPCFDPRLLSLPFPLILIVDKSEYASLWKTRKSFLDRTYFDFDNKDKDKLDILFFHSQLNPFNSKYLVWLEMYHSVIDDIFKYEKIPHELRLSINGKDITDDSVNTLIITAGIDVLTALSKIIIPDISLSKRISDARNKAPHLFNLYTCSKENTFNSYFRSVLDEASLNILIDMGNIRDKVDETLDTLKSLKESCLYTKDKLLRFRYYTVYVEVALKNGKPIMSDIISDFKELLDQIKTSKQRKSELIQMLLLDGKNIAYV